MEKSSTLLKRMAALGAGKAPASNCFALLMARGERQRKPGNYCLLITFVPMMVWICTLPVSPETDKEGRGRWILSSLAGAGNITADSPLVGGVGAC